MFWSKFRAEAVLFALLTFERTFAGFHGLLRRKPTGDTSLKFCHRAAKLGEAGDHRSFLPKLFGSFLQHRHFSFCISDTTNSKGSDADEGRHNMQSIQKSTPTTYT